MADDQAQSKQERKEFFISYTSADRRWAEWMAWHLEEAGYRTMLQVWDFHAGGNFVLDMDTATRQTERTIAVLSPDYFASRFTPSEWAAAFRRDPKGEQGILLPVRVRPCGVEGLLGPISYIDLVDRSEQEALTTLLAKVQRQRPKPVQAPAFPSTPKPDRFPGALPALWNVPYPRNFYFTGREDLLQHLATSLRAEQASAVSQPQAMSGLGGIGKTQIALEYAYRYYQDYQAVLWAQADTRENLTSSYLALATLLDLPEKSEQESARVIAAVKHWLQHNTSWFLILDNADDLALARDFLPPSSGGHVLLTTRAQATGRFAHRLEIESLPTEQGALFLLRRSGLLAPDATLEQAKSDDVVKAKEMCEEVGGLPLALDQAGAYIEETACRLSDYQHLYLHRRTDLLAERRGQLVDDHPLPVATTWSLSFAQVEQNHPAAADLLRLCAFLAPDAIPEEIITEGAAHLGPQLAPLGADTYLLNQAVEALRAYSLLSRDPHAHMLSVHRLVQATLKDQMDEQDRQQWAQRTVRAVNATFPSGEHQTWPQCDRLLPHALLCAELIAQEQMTFLEATHLLNQTGYYLYERARYREAEPLIKSALVIRKQELGAIHPLVASSLNSLADLYFAQGKYLEVEPLYVQALDILRAVFGFEHPSTTYQLNGLANLYKHQGKYGKAEPLYMHILNIWKATYGPRHPNIASSLNNLAELHRAQGKYAEAEPLYLQALDIWEATVGSEHLNIAIVLNNLAALYKEQGRYAEVERLYLRVLSIWEATVEAEHPNVAASLTGLAMLYSDQEKYEDAEPLYQRALKIWKATVGPEHSSVAYPLLGLAVLYSRQGKYEDAEPLYQRVLSTYEQQLGPQHPDTANSLNNLATLYWTQGKYQQAEPLYLRALAIDEQALGPQHPTTQRIRANSARLLRTMGHDAEATALDPP